MKEMKHTPGPWYIRPPLKPDPNQENDRLIYAKGNLHVAEVFQYMSTDEHNGPSLANAKLIATAPEQHEQLEEGRDILEIALKELESISAVPLAVKCYIRLVIEGNKVAIAKATE